MKTILKTSVVLSLFLMVSFSSFAQNTESDSDYRKVKNEISFELLQVINGAYLFTYERHVWKNFSASLSLGYKGKEGLVNISGIDREQIKTKDLFYTGYMIIPEIRYYINGTSKHDYNLSGFYVGLYFKYSDFTSDLNGTYIDDSGDNYNLAFDANLSISSIGLMIGYKLQLTKRLNLDFLIAGPGSGSYKFEIKNTQDLPEEFYEDLNQALEDYSLLDIINSDFRFSQAYKRTSFSSVSFRYGIALGYTF
jgi:hypothetical protein